MAPSIVALIPARAGSKRVPGKNTRLLAGKPLIEYTIEAALASGVFDNVVVCTDDPVAVGIARVYDLQYAERESSADAEPDIAWIKPIMLDWGGGYDAFAILRPTSPFRTAETIKRAWAQFLALDDHFGSLRAVERWEGPHPCKMWFLIGDYIEPVNEQHGVNGAPAHSSPTQRLPPVVRQNASLEMAWTACVTAGGSISGQHVAPFFTEGREGFDINTEDDWKEAERLMACQPVEFLG